MTQRRKIAFQRQKENATFAKCAPAHMLSLMFLLQVISLETCEWHQQQHLILSLGVKYLSSQVIARLCFSHVCLMCLSARKKKKKKKVYGQSSVLQLNCGSPTPGLFIYVSLQSLAHFRSLKRSFCLYRLTVLLYICKKISWHMCVFLVYKKRKSYYF